MPPKKCYLSPPGWGCCLIHVVLLLPDYVYWEELCEGNVCESGDREGCVFVHALWVCVCASVRTCAGDEVETELHFLLPNV